MRQRPLIKRGDRTWLVRVFLGRDPQTGKRQYHNETVQGNKKAAQDKLADLFKDRNAGRLTIGTRSLVMGDLLDDVIRDYRINGQDVEWAERVMKRIRPTFGKMPISSIRRKHVDQHIDQRHLAGGANATINHELSMLRRAFSLAREKGTLAAVPFTIPKLEENNVRKGFFEHEQYLGLRDALPAEIKPVLTFGYYSGCRKGEILGLQWPQVDLLERLVRLEPGETKNDDARIIPLVPELYEALVMQKAIRDEKWPGCPWVFFRNGKKIGLFRKTWDSACRAAGLWEGDPKTGQPTKIFHDLRRTA